VEEVEAVVDDEDEGAGIASGGLSCMENVEPLTEHFHRCDRSALGWSSSSFGMATPLITGRFCAAE
jgi:hypothetical protein